MWVGVLCDSDLLINPLLMVVNIHTGTYLWNVFYADHVSDFDCVIWMNSGGLWMGGWVVREHDGLR